jgi:hypothetical protein
MLAAGVCACARHPWKREPPHPAVCAGGAVVARMTSCVARVVLDRTAGLSAVTPVAVQTPDVPALRCGGPRADRAPLSGASTGPGHEPHLRHARPARPGGHEGGQGAVGRARRHGAAGPRPRARLRRASPVAARAVRVMSPADVRHAAPPAPISGKKQKPSKAQSRATDDRGGSTRHAGELTRTTCGHLHFHRDATPCAQSSPFIPNVKPTSGNDEYASDAAWTAPRAHLVTRPPARGLILRAHTVVGVARRRAIRLRSCFSCVPCSHRTPRGRTGPCRAQWFRPTRRPRLHASRTGAPRC